MSGDIDGAPIHHWSETDDGVALVGWREVRRPKFEAEAGSACLAETAADRITNTSAVD